MSGISLKRWSSALIVLACMSGSAFARHFNPLDSETGATLTVFLDSAAHPTLNGAPISSSTLGVPDEIGVFDSAGNCWGVGNWPAGPTGTITVAGYNNTGIVKPGFKAGATLHFRVWDTLTGEMPAMVTFYPPTGPVPFPPGMTPSTDSTFVAGSPVAYSVPMSITGISAPAAPGLSLPANGAAAQLLTLSLSWGPEAGAASYSVMVSASSTFSVPLYSQTALTAASATVSGLACNTTYYWEANASNFGGTSSWSGIRSFTTLGSHFHPLDSQTGACLTIFLDTAAHPTLNGVPIQHGNIVPDQIGVFDSAGNCWGAGFWPAGPDTTISVAGYSNTGAVKLGMAAGAKLYFKIWDSTLGEMPAAVTYNPAAMPVPFPPGITPSTCSTFVAGNPIAYSVPASLTGLTVPGTPSLAAPANNALAQPVTAILSWNSVAFASSYALQISTSAAFATTLSYLTGITATAGSPGGLAANATYYWRVNAANFAGIGGWSAAWTFSTITQTVVTASTGTSGNILGIASGAAKGYVAVGTSGTVSTSTDGVHWTPQTSGTHASLHSVVYDEFVAVGDSGTILTSPDGVTWTPRTSNTTQNLNAIAYNGSQFVAAGNGGTILTSSDGIAWAAATSGISANLTGAAYGDGLFAVVGAGGVILTSPTGTAWTIRSSGSSVNLTGITCGGATFIAVGGSGTILGSPDGINWTGRTSGTTDSLLSVAYGAGQFAAVGTGGVLLTSTNGSNWSGGTAGTGTTLSAVIITGNQIIGAGSSGAVVNSVTTDVPVLSSPVNFSANLPASGVSLSWANETGAISYTVEVSTDAAFGSTVLSQRGLVSTGLAAGPLAIGTTYYWQVGAQFSTYSGAWSSLWNFTTLPPPSAPALSFPGNAAVSGALSLSLSWGTVGAASTYTVMVSTSSLFGSTILCQNGLTAQSVALAGLANYTTYYWQANAVNASGMGAWSGIWSFTTPARFAIPLASGWFMYSLNIHPADSSTSGVFGGLKGFILAMDGSDNLYWPGASLDEIVTLHTGSGYWVLDTLTTDTLKLTGAADAVASTPIPLPALNWNLVTYLPQTGMPVTTALAPISAQLVLAMDGASNFYWPAASLNEIGTMTPGNGYYILTNAATSLTYPAIGGPAKVAAASGNPPGPAPLRHFTKHTPTGNFAAFLAKRIDIGGRAAADRCEVGAFDTKGNLVGAGTVKNGAAAFAIWGKDPMSRAQDGCGPSEKITFKLWNGTAEYPLQAAGGEPVYAARTILSATLAVPAGALISSFNLARAYPNPFKGSVNIAFDVPTIAGVAKHAVEIAIFDMKGSLVMQLAKGEYRAGHYELAWNCNESRKGAVGSSVFLVRMKATGFDKQIKLVRLEN